MNSTATQADPSIERMMVTAYLSLCELRDVAPEMAPELHDAHSYLRARLAPAAPVPRPSGLRRHLRLVKS